MRVVFDANVVVAGVCWQGEGWLCLMKLARRLAFAYGTAETLQETHETCLRVIRQERPDHNAAGRLTWYLDKVKLAEAVPIGKQRSRDAKDDHYIIAALAAKAEIIVSYDKDLLTLRKPFGITIIRPASFLRLI